MYCRTQYSVGKHCNCHETGRLYGPFRSFWHFNCFAQRQYSGFCVTSQLSVHPSPPQGYRCVSFIVPQGTIQWCYCFYRQPSRCQFCFIASIFFPSGLSTVKNYRDLLEIHLFFPDIFAAGGTHVVQQCGKNRRKKTVD